MVGKRSHQLTGVAGVHFVSAYLAHLGFHAVPTIRNIAGPDVLISTHSGSRLLALQVKTTRWAIRTRGRGTNKNPHHYEWDIGWSSARQKHNLLFYALVDVKEFQELPEVFIVPSAVIAEYFRAGPEGWPRARYHPEIELMEEYRNNWGILRDALESES